MFAGRKHVVVAHLSEKVVIYADVPEESIAEVQAVPSRLIEVIE